jgi:PEGA domain
MTRQLTLLAIIGLMGMGTGCATLRGSDQKMRIETDPTGANLTVDSKTYTTPVDVVLKRREVHKVTVAKEGYRPITFNFASTWDGASMTDFALPGGAALLGASVATGSDKQFNQLAKITLEKTTQPNPTPLEVFQYRGKLLTKEEYDLVKKNEEKDRSRFQTPENN